MTEKRTYSGTSNSGYVSLNCSIRHLVLLLLITLLPAVTLTAQDEPAYDEVSVYLKIPLLGVSEIEAVIKGEEVYLPVTTLFDLLKIRNVPSEDLDLISGFFISPEAEYTIDRRNNQITYGGKSYQLSEGDLVRSETNLYLRSLYYGKIFGLDCKFSFRDLTVTLETKFELPGIRELKQEEMRANLTRLKGEIEVDTTVGRSYPGFRFGMADWSVYASEQAGVGTEARLNLALGAVIAGGEATVSLNYYTGDTFSEKQQYYLWRHVNNDRPLLRQILAGKIISQATSSIYNPVVGIQLTSTPTTFRRSFGSYTLTDKTEPGWTAELYVNNVLVDYVKADASGFFTFEVPLVYGNTQVKLKFYGPWGEERTREQNIAIPYNFLPQNEFEYTVSAGVVEDSLWSRYSRASLGYGATRFLTIGGGAEYLSSVTSGPLMPFVNASLRLARNLLLAGEYTYGVRAKGTLTYRLPSNIQLDLNYTKYDKDQKAISYNYLEERRASLSVPLHIKKFFAYSRLSYYQIVLPVTYYTTAEWTIAGSLFGVNTNLTTYAIMLENKKPNVYSNLSLAVRLPAGFLLMPQLQYSYNNNEVVSSKIRLERQLFERGYLTTSYEQYYRTDLRMGEVGFRYDFSFAQAGLTVRQTNKQTTFVQYARGSLINDRPTDYLKADNRTNVGRGGISLTAFLDLNSNGLRDAGEPSASGLNIRSSGGRIERIDKDSTIHILGLEPYVKYYIDLDESGFDNISWRLKNRTYAVIVDPNMLKLIEVPVNVVGEASGSVVLEAEGRKSGIGRMIVNFLNTDGLTVARALTEEDGYFSYFGLNPGHYLVSPDTAQLRRLNMTSEPDQLSFSIAMNVEGDYIDGLDFVLRKIRVIPDIAVAADTTTIKKLVERAVTTDTSYLVIHEVTRELVTITEDYYAVQFGAFQNKVYAEIMKKKVESALDKKVELFEEAGFWKVRITGFADREDLQKYIPIIHAQGITEIWIISNKAVKGEWITLTREDSLAIVKQTQLEKETPAVKEPVIEKYGAIEINGTTIQLGALISAEESAALADRLLAATEKMVTVRQEQGVFKIQITDFADTSEVREFIPLLRKFGFKDIVVIPGPEAVLVPVPPAGVTPAKELPAVVEPEVIAPERAEIAEEVVPPPPVPRFILNAASYRKLSAAERAKKKIEKTLKLPVKIIEEWDSYRVIVTGFFTREETFPYYPELAGLGFTNIFVYEIPLIDR